MMLGKDRATHLSKLATPKGRDEQQAMLLDAVSLVREGLRAGLVTEVLFADERHRDLLEDATARRVVLTEATPELLAKIAHVETSPGILAIARRPAPAAAGEVFAAPRSFAVYLDRLADPGNVGAIARTAAATGASAIILSSGCADPWNPKALRASAGALLRLPVVRDPGAGESAWCPAGLMVWRAVARGGVPPEAAPEAERLLLHLGNESHGTRTTLTGAVSLDVTIPMAGAIESLNVAAAAAILLHVAASRAGRTAP